MDRFMHSGDDMTQGYPVVMESYGIGVKSEYPGITRPWYTDDTGALGSFANIELYFDSL